MPIRTTKPFTLGSFDVPQAAGTYRVVTEEEVMEGMSSPAYRRHSTTLHTPAVTAMALAPWTPRNWKRLWKRTRWELHRE